MGVATEDGRLSARSDPVQTITKEGLNVPIVCLSILRYLLRIET